MKTRKIFVVLVLVCSVLCIGYLLWSTTRSSQSAASSSTKQTASTPSHLFAGIPKSDRELLLLENLGFVCAYDEQRQNPAWVAYRLADQPKFEGHKRIGFTVDSRTVARVSSADYTNSGYSRGHLAPSYAVYSWYGKQAHKQAYLMSNICPQLQYLNGGRWKNIEDLLSGGGQARNYWAKSCREIWVITGPIFDSSPSYLEGTQIEIPDQFFKILIDLDEAKGSLRALCFILPNTREPRLALEEYLTSIDMVEQATRLDFLWELEDEQEDALEAKTAATLWAK